MVTDHSIRSAIVKIKWLNITIIFNYLNPGKGILPHCREMKNVDRKVLIHFCNDHVKESTLLVLVKIQIF